MNEKSLPLEERRSLTVPDLAGDYGLSVNDEAIDQFIVAEQYGRAYWREYRIVTMGNLTHMSQIQQFILTPAFPSSSSFVLTLKAEVRVSDVVPFNYCGLTVQA